jgi:FkbM family methyltransferase
MDVLTKALFKTGLIKNVNFTRRKNGFKIPLTSGEGVANLVGTEPWMRKILKQLLYQFPGTFIDVGVNVGQTLLKLRELSQVDYIGFEPNPKCIHYVQRLIEANHFENVSLYPVGLSDKTHIAQLHYYGTGETDSAASVVYDFRQDVLKTEYVPCFRFDELNIEESIGVVKIDVEGSELWVLKGMQEMVKNNRPAFIMEILPVYSDELQERLVRQEEIEGLLKEWNYSISRINQKTGSLTPVESIGIHSDLDACEYVLMPNDLK